MKKQTLCTQTLCTLFAISLFYLPLLLNAQNVGINATGDEPNSHAILDVKSSTMGLLIPRMTTAQKTTFVGTLTADEKGMLVYDADENHFFFWDGTAFKKMNAGVFSVLADADGDTKVQAVELGTDDFIRFNTEGKEHFRMKAGRLEVMNTGNSVFLGQGAGANDDLNDRYNTFIGEQAGNKNTAGSNNTASGSSALYSNTTGSDNTASGISTLYSNTMGSSNTASGSFALYSNTTGSDNTASSAGALLFNTTGTENTASGYKSLYSNKTGNSNTASGVEAGFKSTGSGNIFIGFRAGYYETGSDKLYIANSNTSTPLIWGDFNNDQLKINGELFVRDVSFGGGYDLAWDAVTKRVNYGGTSSRRYKRNIRDLEDNFSFILKAQPKTFTWLNNPDRWDIGYIAEEMDSLGLSNLVIYDTLGRPSGFKYKMMALYVNEMLKVHHEDIEGLKVKSTQLTVSTNKMEKTELKIINQEAKIKDQEKRISELEETINQLLKWKEEQVENI